MSKVYPLEEIQELWVLEEGDHIAVKSGKCCIGYYHHGIFLGLRKGVAHFAGTTKNDARLQYVDILHFMNKKQLFRVNYSTGECLDSTAVVQKAEELVGKPENWKKFDLVDNNCEHFATYCKTGIPFSMQTKILAKCKTVVSSLSSSGVS